MISPRALDSLPLFAGLNREALAALASRGVERRYRTGQVLFRAGEEPKGMFVVLEGEVRVVRETVGRGQVVHSEGQGGTLGEIPLFSGGPFPATGTATEPTVCAILTREAVGAAIAADPAFALRLLAGLGLRVRGLIERLDRLAFTSVRARLAAWIVERARRSQGPILSLGITQSQLADELGTVREVVVKELAALRRSGAIRAHGAGRLEIVNRDALEAAINGSAAPSPRAPARGGAAGGGRRG